MPTTRDQALVLVASTDSDLVDRVTESVRSTGAATCRASSAAGCLRVATAVGPDVVLLDARFSPKLERLLAHTRPPPDLTSCASTSTSRSNTEWSAQTSGGCLH
jgi:hypothetical protein